MTIYGLTAKTISNLRGLLNEGYTNHDALMKNLKSIYLLNVKEAAKHPRGNT